MIKLNFVHKKRYSVALFLLPALLLSLCLLSSCALLSPGEESVPETAGVASSATSENSSLSEALEEILPEGSDKASSGDFFQKIRETIFPKQAETPDPEEVCPDLSLRIFLDGLETEQQENLAALMLGVEAFSEDITLPHPCSTEEIADLVLLLHTECPEYFWLSDPLTYQYVLRDKTDVISVQLTYRLTPEEVASMEAELEEIIAPLVAEAADLEEWEKILYLYNFLTDEDSAYSTSGSEAGSVYGAIIEKSARCEGYALAMSLLCHRCGIACSVLSGDVSSSGEGHAWNLVYCEDGYYCLDPTADAGKLSSAGVRYYGAFLVPLELTEENYTLDTLFAARLPEGATGRSYEKTYHAFIGSLVSRGEEAASLLPALLEASYAQTGEYTVSLQFESREDYDSFLSSWDKIVKNWMISVSISGSLQLFSLDNYRVAVITICPS